MKLREWMPFLIPLLIISGFCTAYFLWHDKKEKECQTMCSPSDAVYEHPRDGKNKCFCITKDGEYHLKKIWR